MLESEWVTKFHKNLGFRVAEDGVYSYYLQLVLWIPNLHLSLHLFVYCIDKGMECLLSSWKQNEWIVLALCVSPSQNIHDIIILTGVEVLYPTLCQISQRHNQRLKYLRAETQISGIVLSGLWPYSFALPQILLRETLRGLSFRKVADLTNLWLNRKFDIHFIFISWDGELTSTWLHYFKL